MSEPDLEGRVAEIEAIIGHKIPRPYSNTLMEDCRMSQPDFAAELIRVSKFVWDEETTQRNEP